LYPGTVLFAIWAGYWSLVVSGDSGTGSWPCSLESREMGSAPWTTSFTSLGPLGSMVKFSWLDEYMLCLRWTTPKVLGR